MYGLFQSKTAHRGGPLKAIDEQSLKREITSSFCCRQQQRQLLEV
jgi:hypothetical protein